MEIALNKWHIASGSKGCDSIVHDITSFLLLENCPSGEKINSIINSWNIPIWWNVFFAILKKHGVEYALVSNKKRSEKFYAVVNECSIDKMLELSELYTSFLNKLGTIEENPYFEFIVFGKDEISTIDIGKDFRKIE